MSVTDASSHRHSFDAGRSDTFIAALVDVWHDLLRTMFDPYRPERHYMRGPGPACARKQALRN